MNFRFQNSTLADLPFIFDLFSKAIDYQKRNNFDLWPTFSEELIRKEINENRHWKITNNNEIACILSVEYSDPVIWGSEKDKDPSVYLHRIAINPLYKGQGIMKLIKDWAIMHAKTLNKKHVRMDTWGNNISLRNYYVSCGFPYIGQKNLKNIEGLPTHYCASHLSLFEINIDPDLPADFNRDRQ